MKNEAASTMMTGADMCGYTMLLFIIAALITTGAWWFN
jgi:hypothetical protein